MLTISPRSVFVAPEGHTFLAAGTCRPCLRRPCRGGSLYTFHSVQVLGRWIIRRYLQNSSFKINPKANIYTKERFLVHSKLRADLLRGSLPFSRSKMPPHGPTQSAPPFSSLSSSRSVLCPTGCLQVGWPPAWASLTSCPHGISSLGTISFPPSPPPHLCSNVTFLRRYTLTTLSLLNLLSWSVFSTSLLIFWHTR